MDGQVFIEGWYHGSRWSANLLHRAAPDLLLVKTMEVSATVEAVAEHGSPGYRKVEHA